MSPVPSTAACVTQSHLPGSRVSHHHRQKTQGTKRLCSAEKMKPSRMAGTTSLVTAAWPPSHPKGAAWMPVSVRVGSHGE